MIQLLSILFFFGTHLLWLVVFLWFIRTQRISRRALLTFLFVDVAILLGSVGISIYLRYRQIAAGTGDIAQYMSEYLFKSGIERLGSHWLASAGFAVLLTLLFVWLWRAKRGMVIDGSDVTLLSLGMLTVQWPDMLIFLLVTFLLVLLLQIVLVSMKKRTVNDRLIITPAIPIAVILTLLFGPYLSAVTGLDVIRF